MPQLSRRVLRARAYNFLFALLASFCSQIPVSAQEGSPADNGFAEHRGTTYFGPVGGISVLDASSGLPRSFRLQAAGDFFVKHDYLGRDDRDRYAGSALSLSVTPLEHIELSAALSSRSNKNSQSDPDVSHAVGDVHIDAKGYHELSAGMSAGGDIQASFLNGPDDVGVDFSATSWTLRGNFSWDLRKSRPWVPLLFRLNTGYVFDNSARLFSATERTRLAALRAQNPGVPIDAANEVRHLASRAERLVFAINRVDHALVALGVEVPLNVGSRITIHPILEWELDLPINRQGFDCPYLVNSDGTRPADADSCLEHAGPDSWAQRVTLGARVHGGLPGLAILAAVDLGIGSARKFVYELAPGAPYRVLVAASYAVDWRPRPPRIVTVRVPVEVPVTPPLGRVVGRVIQRGAAGTAVAGAAVMFRGGALSPLLTDPDGAFASCPLAPGEVQMDIQAESHEPGTCSATIPANGGDVPVTCELSPLPRVGAVRGDVIDGRGAPVPDAILTLTGPEGRTLVTDSEGRFRADALPFGAYRLAIDRPGHLMSITSFSLQARETIDVSPRLIVSPKVPTVQIPGVRIVLRSEIRFRAGSAELDSESAPILAQLADKLLRQPQLTRVEVQGHGDDVSTPEQSLLLAQARADAVSERLVRAGVQRERLVPKGYGAAERRVRMPRASAITLLVLERTAP